jgi:hypothetical protein
MKHIVLYDNYDNFLVKLVNNIWTLILDNDPIFTIFKQKIISKTITKDFDLIYLKVNYKHTVIEIEAPYKYINIHSLLYKSPSNISNILNKYKEYAVNNLKCVITSSNIADKVQVTCSGILLDSSYTKVLILKGGYGDETLHKWGFPKGKYKYGETTELCSIREICEESGIDLRFINYKQIPLKTKDIALYVLDKPYTDIPVKINTVNNEIIDYKWMDINELYKLLRNSDRTFNSKSYDTLSSLKFIIDKLIPKPPPQSIEAPVEPQVKVTPVKSQVTPVEPQVTVTPVEPQVTVTPVKSQVTPVEPQVTVTPIKTIKSKLLATAKPFEPSKPIESNKDHISQVPNKFIHNNIVYEYTKKLSDESYGTVWLGTRLTTIKNTVVIVKYTNELLPSVLKILNTIKGICFRYAVCIYESFLYDFERYIIYEYIEGYTLAEFMTKYGSSKRQTNTQIFNDLLLGFYEFSKYKIVNQNINESTIMFDTKNKIFRYINWIHGCSIDYCINGICKEPCGFKGLLYTNPPESNSNGDSVFNRLSVSKDISINDISFNKLVINDMWSIGVVLYDFYTLKIDINKYYSDPKNILANKSKKLIVKMINDLYVNDNIKRVMKMLLEPNSTARLVNYTKIITVETNMIIKSEINKFITKIISIFGADYMNKNLKKIVNNPDKNKVLNDLYYIYNILVNNSIVGYEANSIPSLDNLPIDIKCDTSDDSTFIFMGESNNYWCLSKEELSNAVYIDTNKFKNPYDDNSILVLTKKI